MIFRFIISASLLVSLFINTFAQTVPADLKTFDKDGLKFSYPADWTLTDRSTVQTQYLLLSKTGSIVLFIVVSPRESLTGQSHFTTLLGNVHRAYFSAIRNSLGTTDKPAVQEGICMELKGRKISGTRLKGVYNTEKSTGDIYPFASNGRLLGLVYLRATKDETAADPIWKELVDSIAVENRSKFDIGLTYETEFIDGGVLNGVALKLPKPIYPSEAVRERAQGTISVDVTIDENGNVISAEASQGNQYLRFAAMAAAKQSKFSPTTVCGKPTKVSGKITYNFVRP